MSPGRGKSRKESTNPKFTEFIQQNTAAFADKGTDDRSKLLSVLAKHAESINSKMEELLKRSERLSDKAKRLATNLDLGAE